MPTTEGPARATVLIVDDHPVFRSGLRSLLSTSFEVVAEAGEGADAVEAATRHNPDVAVIDIHLPGMDGIATARQLRTQAPATNVVILSATDDAQAVLEAVEAGVSGYVLKGQDGQTILRAVRLAHEGQAYLPPLLAKRLFGHVSEGERGERSTKLSSRELVVLQLLGAGTRNKEIASVLCISERTVGNHVASIYSKLGVTDRAEAIIYAIKHGIVQI